MTAHAAAGALCSAAWRHRPHGALAALAAGLALAPAGAGAVAAACVVAAVAAAAAAPGRGAPEALGTARVPRAAAALVAVQAVAAGALAGELRLTVMERPATRALPGMAVAARATLLERPRPGAFGVTAVVRIDRGRAAGLKALARFAPGLTPPAAVGSRFHLRGLVARPRPSREFDYDAFLRSRGVLRQILVRRVAPAGRRAGAWGALDRVRERAEAALAGGLAAERGALARGMVLGQDEAVREDVREDFRRSGLAHLLAASGQNVMLLCALALPLLAIAGLRHGARALAMLAVVAVYVPLAGAGASIVRAGIMGAAGIVAMLAGRPGSRLYALLLAALVTLAWNPRATGDPAWQLSFAAVAGIAVATGELRRRIESRLPEARAPGARAGRLRRAAAEGLAVTLAATTATAPLMAHHFGAVSLASLPANLLALPAVAPVMWIGMVQAAAGQLGSPGLALAGVLSVPQEPPVAWIAAVARRLAEPPWAQADVALSAPAAMLVFAVLGGAALALHRARPPEPDRRRVGAATLAAGGAVAAAAAFAWSAPPAPPKGLRVDFLDVGQGDATLVRDGAAAAILFDGGPPEANVAAMLRRLGVRRLSAVVATHMSRDHHGGLADVLRRFRVGLLLDGGDGTTDRSYLAMLRAARERGVRRLPATAGVRIAAGPLEVNVLAPAPRGPGARDGDADPNRRAVVALAESRGFRVLLTADAESPSLLPLRLPRAHALKVPHHGSADPGLGAVLSRVRPRIAAIEVGARNRYGHPAPGTLAALRAAGARVFRTDHDGTVSVEVEGGRALIRTGR